MIDVVHYKQNEKILLLATFAHPDKFKVESTQNII